MMSTDKRGHSRRNTGLRHLANRRSRGLVVLLMALLAVLSACSDSGGSGTTEASDTTIATETTAASDTTAPAEETTTTAVATTVPEPVKVTMQLGWIPSNNQMGEIVAMHKGFYAEEGIELSIIPGGPNVDGVATVASGKADIGQLSSSPSLMLAISQGIPIKAFAVGAQQHPFTYFSLPETPLDSAQDLAGKVVGTQPTAMILLDALLAKNNMELSDLKEAVPIGFDISPLLTGQVDVWTGWQTNTGQLNQLPEGYNELRLWDTGVQLYALVYYAKVGLLEDNPDLIERFLRATAKGWVYARDNVDEAVGYLIDEYPDLDPEAEAEGALVILGFVFDEKTDTGGWATMDPEVWNDQIQLYSDLGQFEADTPALDDVMTIEFLEATVAERGTG